MSAIDAARASCGSDNWSFQENRHHVRMVALYICWYNFALINSSVRMSPAMAARLPDRIWDIGDIVKLIEERETQA